MIIALLVVIVLLLVYIASGLLTMCRNQSKMNNWNSQNTQTIVQALALVRQAIENKK